jgi:hypothetical protein
MASVVQHSPIERLREVDTNLGVLGRPANSNVRVGGSFQTSQTVSDDEDGCAESTERVIDQTRPSDKG